MLSAEVLLMHVQSPYRTHSPASITLDTICNSAFYFSGLWTCHLKRNQAPYLLRLIINKLYGSSHGALFKSRMRCAHASLAANLGLSRPWTCHLIAVLRESGWITTEAPRLPNGQQEITIFKPGPMLKRVLVMLIKSRQSHRVNDSKQKTPTPEQIEKNKSFLRELIGDLALKKKMRTATG